MNQDNRGAGGRDQRTPEMLEVEIGERARVGDFAAAEQLRDLLLANHPMALSSIIASGEVIEEEKSRRIDRDHLAIWEKLYAGLSREEQNCLFYACKSATVGSGKVMIRQGKPVPRLLFVDSGRVTLFHTQGNDRILLGQLSRGDVLGEETFFQLSSPTFSAGAQTEVRLRYLDKSATASWEDTHPGLYQKLADYCQQNCRASQLLQQKNIEKRQYPRQKAESRVTAHLLGEDGGRSGESYRGSLLDLSLNGACFEIHCSRADTAQALLGRTLDLDFAQDNEAVGSGMVRQGAIVKVGTLLHNDFTIHVRLHTELSHQELARHLPPEGK